MKRAISCGSTPMMTSERKGAPAARTASTGFIDISSTASATSLERKPSEATISAGMPRDQLHDLDRRFRIERGGGLIGEQQIGLLHQRAGNADALALPARELVR